MTKTEWAAMLTLEALVTLLILRILGPRALELGRRFGYWWGVNENPYRYREPVVFEVDPDTTLREAQEIARVLIEAQDICEEQ